MPLDPTDGESPMRSIASGSTGRSAGRPDLVQSLSRALRLLELLADSGGETSITELAERSGLPQPTIYRLLRTLVADDYVRQGASRRYSLGPRLIRLGESAGMALGAVAKPHLVKLVEATGENANLALLDGDQIVYVAQAPSRHAVRMFTEVGRRVDAHCTAAGKVLLADFSDAQVRSILLRRGMPARTSTTITDLEQFVTGLGAIREQGFAIDDGENEVGVRCFAVPIPDAPARLAISISGPAERMDSGMCESAVPLMRRTAEEVSRAVRSNSEGEIAL